MASKSTRAKFTAAVAKRFMKQYDTAIMVTDRELGIILASLRLWQSVDAGGGIPVEFNEIAAEADGSVMSDAEIDALCERLNCD